MDNNARFEFVRQFKSENILPYLLLYKLNESSNLTNYISLVDSLQNSNTLSEFLQTVSEWKSVVLNLLPKDSYHLIVSEFPNFNTFLQWLVFQFSTNFKQNSKTIFSKLIGSSDQLVNILYNDIRQSISNCIYVYKLIEFYPKNFEKGYLKYLDIDTDNQIVNSNFYYIEDNNYFTNSLENNSTNSVRYYFIPNDLIHKVTYITTTTNKYIYSIDVGTNLNKQPSLRVVNELILFNVHLKNNSILNYDSVVSKDTIKSIKTTEYQDQLFVLEAETRSSTDVFANILGCPAETDVYSFFFSKSNISVQDQFVEFVDQIPIYINYHQMGIGLSTQSSRSCSVVLFDFKKVLSRTAEIEIQTNSRSINGVRFTSPNNEVLFEFGYFLPDHLKNTSRPYLNYDTLSHRLLVQVRHNLYYETTQNYQPPINSGKLSLRPYSVDTIAAVVSHFTWCHLQRQRRYDLTMLYFTERIDAIFKEPPPGIDFDSYNFFNGGDPLRRLQGCNLAKVQLYEMMTASHNMFTINVPENLVISSYATRIVCFLNTFWELTSETLTALSNAFPALHFATPTTLKRIFVVYLYDVEFIILFERKSDGFTKISVLTSCDFTTSFNALENYTSPYQPKFINVQMSWNDIVQSAENQLSFTIVSDCGIVQILNLNLNTFQRTDPSPPLGVYYSWVLVDTITYSLSMETSYDEIVNIYTNNFTATDFGYNNGVLYYKNQDSTFSSCKSFDQTELSQNWNCLSNNLDVVNRKYKISDQVTPVGFYVQNIKVGAAASVMSILKLLYYPIEYNWYLICLKTPLYSNILQETTVTTSPNSTSNNTNVPVLLYFLLKKPRIESLNVLSKQSTTVFVPHSFQLWFFVLLSQIDDSFLQTTNLMVNLINLILLNKQYLLNWYNNGLTSIPEFDARYKSFFDLIKFKDDLPVTSDLEMSCLNIYKFLMSQSQIYFPNTNLKIYTNSSLSGNMFIQNLYSLLPYDDIIFDSYTVSIPPIIINNEGVTTINTSMPNYTKSEYLEHAFKFVKSESSSFVISNFNFKTLYNIDFSSAVLQSVYRDAKSNTFRDLIINEEKTTSISSEKLMYLFSSLKSSQQTKQPQIINLLQLPEEAEESLQIFKQLYFCNVFIYGPYSLLSSQIYLPLSKEMDTMDNVLSWLTNPDDTSIVDKKNPLLIINDPFLDNLFLKLKAVQTRNLNFTAIIIRFELNTILLSVANGSLVSNIFASTLNTNTAPFNFNNSAINETCLNLPNKLELKFCFKTRKIFDPSIPTNCRLVSKNGTSLNGTLVFTIDPNTFASYKQIKIYTVALVFDTICLDFFNEVKQMEIFQQDTVLLQLTLLFTVKPLLEKLNFDFFYRNITPVQNSNYYLNTINEALTRPDLAIEDSIYNATNESWSINSVNISFSSLNSDFILIYPMYKSKQTVISHMCLYKYNKDSAAADKKFSITFTLFEKSATIYYEQTLEYNSLNGFLFGNQTVIINKKKNEYIEPPVVSDNNYFYLVDNYLYFGIFNVFIPVKIPTGIRYKVVFKVENKIVSKIEYLI